MGDDDDERDESLVCKDISVHGLSKKQGAISLIKSFKDKKWIKSLAESYYWVVFPLPNEPKGASNGVCCVVVYAAVTSCRN